MGVKLEFLFMGMIFVRLLQLGLKQLGIVSINYSNPLRLRLRGQ